jgi:hypothetical protein
VGPRRRRDSAIGYEAATGKGLASVTEEWLKGTTRPVKRAQIDTTAPNVARVWNYLVGGRDNFDIDRKAAKQLIAAAPVMEHVGLASRAFLRRVITSLAGEDNIRQFLDIGTGIPAAGNTHEVAQSIAPESKIVYVDNDPIVLTHARAMLRSAEGVTSYINADARDPAKILSEARETLDFGAPVAVVLIDLLNFISDDSEVRSILATLMEAFVAGSYLVIMQPANDIDATLLAAEQRWNQVAASPVSLRGRDEVTAWFAGLDLVEPGIVMAPEWRPDADDPKYDMPIPLYVGVARKPLALRGDGEAEAVASDAEQYGGPSPERAPVLGDALKLRLGDRARIHPVEVADVFGQPWLGECQCVGDAGRAHEDQRGVGGADAGQLPQVRERLRRIHPGQQRRVKRAVEGGPRDRMQPLDSLGGDAAQRLRLQQSVGERKRVDLLACHGARAAQFGSDPVPDHRGLAAVAARADDRPCGGLVRRMEEHGAQPRVVVLQLTDQRVARTDLRPSGGRMVQREDAEHLPPDGRRFPVGLDVSVDDAVRALSQARAGVMGHVVGDESQPHLVLVGRGPFGRGPVGDGARSEAESRRCRQ